MATVDSTRTGFPSIYHVNCEILISRGSKRCSYCKNHRKSLCAMACRDLKREYKQTNACSHMDSHLVTGVDHSIAVEKTQALKISLPLESYVNAPVDSICSLQNRLNNCKAMPSGIQSIFITSAYNRMFLGSNKSIHTNKFCIKFGQASGTL